MTTHFSGRQFGRAAAWRIGLFLVAAFGIPLGLCLLDRLDGSNVTFTEAIALITQTPIGFFLYLLFVLSMIRPSWRRMRALDLPGWSGLFVPFLLFLDIPYLVTKPGSSIFGQSIGSMGGNVPLYILMALGLITAMALIPAPAEGERPFTRFGIAGKAAALMLAFVIFYPAQLIILAKWMDYLRPRLEEGDPSLHAFLLLIEKSYWLLVFQSYACFAFVLLLAWCVIRYRKWATPPSHSTTS